MTTNLAQLLSDAWDYEIRTSANPYKSDWLSEQFGGPRLTYRERLDKPVRNFFGDLVPRIDIVRKNLRLVGGPRTALGRRR